MQNVGCIDNKKSPVKSDWTGGIEIALVSEQTC